MQFLKGKSWDQFCWDYLRYLKWVMSVIKVKTIVIFTRYHQPRGDKLIIQKNLKNCSEADWYLIALITRSQPQGVNLRYKLEPHQPERITQKGEIWEFFSWFLDNYKCYVWKGKQNYRLYEKLCIAYGCPMHLCTSIHKKSYFHCICSFKLIPLALHV